MEGGARLFGHQVHPMLIAFPLGLLSTSLVFDILYLVTSDSSLAVVAYWLIPAGLIGGLIAALFGWIDWFAIPSGTRAKRVGIMHAFANVVVMVLFLGSWYLRGVEAPPDLVSLLLSIAGAGVALVGGWLGGELVERLSIGVHTGAEPNAPNSLAVPNLQHKGHSENR